MPAPALQAYVQGQGVVDASNLNTFCQTCNTITDLRAFVGLTGVSVITRGQAAPGDGYGGFYEWNASSVAADNGLTVIAPTGAAASGRWIMIVLGGATGPNANPFMVLATATEDLAAGAFVNIYPVLTLPNVRNASALDPAAFATGFVGIDVSAGTSCFVQTAGINSIISVSTTHSQVWLSETVPGGYQTTAPSTPGRIVQSLGPAISGTGIVFFPQPTVEL